MAEPDSILQLGIEAARDGNKEEARNLFRLLTRQEPKNAQAWLWLAGVAENREERQAALERVVELDPSNEMAIKGLQALGVQPGSRPAPPPPPVEVVTPAAAAPASSPYDDDDPFAELDALSGVMADAEGPVRRNDPPPIGSSVDSGAATDADTTSRTASSPRIFSSSRSTPTSRSVYDEDDDEEVAPPRRGVPLLNILLGLVALCLIGLLIAFLFFRGDGQQVADQPGAEQTAAAAGTAPAATTDPALSPTTEGGGVGTSPTEAITTTATLEQPTAEPTAEAAAPTAAPADVSQANPVIVAANTPLQSEGWLYDFNQPTYAAPIIGPLGQYQPNNGRFVVVLIFAVNSTGTSQSIPANFFVLRDAQGRVWEARPEVSEAYVIPGVNADLSQTQPLPTDGLTRSVALIFDVAPDATNLVFFARSNPTQGWLVLPNV